VSIRRDRAFAVHEIQARTYRTVEIKDREDLGLRVTWSEAHPCTVEVSKHLNSSVRCDIDQLQAMLARLQAERAKCI
jgi:hypothetical protein